MLLTLAEIPIGVFDALTVVVAALSYGIGRKRGLVWQLSGVATLVLGGICATILSGPVGGLITEGIVGRFAGWVLVYALVAISLYVLSLKLKHRIEKLEFDELDQRFGGLLGVFKGLFAFGVLVLIASGISTRIATSVRESASGQALLVLVDELRPVVPERVASALFPGEGPPPTPEPTEPGLEPTAPEPSAAPATDPDPGVPAPADPLPANPLPADREPNRDPEPEASGPDPDRWSGRADPDPWDPNAGPTDPLAPPR
ncbi:MAG: CvpA family protein [Planctomycetes bacterium]|nr:CvpA family protein [Planctomycetota bacterium]